MRQTLELRWTYDQAVHMRRAAVRLTRPFALLVRVRTDRRVVALTFDDGPDVVWTPKLLDLLKTNGVRATFFVDGPAAQRHPGILQRMGAEGHAVANHGWAHESAALSSSMRGLVPQYKDIRRARRVLGRTICLYRPPFGHESRWTRFAAAANRQQLVYWSAAMLDWVVTSPSDLCVKIKDASTPGAIVLLHDRLRHAVDPEAFNRGYLVDALAQLLADPARDVDYVTVPELMKSGEPIYRLRRRMPPPLATMIEQAQS